MTKVINSQMNLIVQTVERDTWQEVMTMKLKKKLADSRVGRRRALLILAGEEESQR